MEEQVAKLDARQAPFLVWGTVKVTGQLWSFRRLFYFLLRSALSSYLGCDFFTQHDLGVDDDDFRGWKMNFLIHASTPTDRGSSAPF